MKKIGLFLLSLIILFNLSISAFAADEVSVYVNGQKVNSNQSAIISSGRTLVPLRAICEALKCEVTWEPETQTAQIQNEVTIVSVQINNYVMRKVDRKNEDKISNIELDVPPIIYNYITLVPARAIAEALYADVLWDGNKRRVDIKLEYDYIGSYEEGLAVALKDGKFGYINEKKETVLPFIYDGAGTFRYGVAHVEKDGKDMYVDKNGKYISDSYPINTIGMTVEGMTSIMSNSGKYGFVNEKFEYIVPFVYDDAENYENGYAKVKQGKYWGAIDKLGNVIVPIKYDFVRDVSEGMFVVEKGDKYGVVNSNGEIVVDLIYDDARNYSEGLLQVEKNGKIGYIDKSGEEIIPLIYDFGFSFNEGKAKVEKNGDLFFIDKTGKRVK